MTLRNRVFGIVQEDEDMMGHFPELKLGTRFKVVETHKDSDYGEGIVAVQIENGPYIHVESRGGNFWCFWEENTMCEIEEILDIPETSFTPDVDINLFNGRPIVTQLYKMAGQENCDSEEYDLMQKAADYIAWLERKIIAGRS